MKQTENNPRRRALKKLAGTGLAGMLVPGLSQRLMAAEERLPDNLKGNINHSVCRWCYNDIAFEDLCKAAVSIGLKSIELAGPEEWPVLKSYGLDCAMPWGAGMGIERGWNNPELHAELIQSYEEVIPKVAEAGYKQIICFSGNRNGLDDETGIKNCAEGLKKVMPTAEKYGVILCMELLNSKVNHKDYQADHTAWGVEVCKAVGSENIKLLYDIYHMQIMEGDVIATIKAYHPYISHYHTGGVPGRNEIDETQELYYPAIMKAILDTGYQGYVGQEFIPKRPDKLASLKQGVEICDV
ncbi:hydroxypyruvate isomerase [Cyclobacterium xiamenense]|uniref:Hydroxypyruvate isomerase n=1 Tax=Cyclobacterium xiamenense TaxID=1297121 RepID=A0A1H7BBG9_9BACT|nr:TIM barrel protein [Cyclobacterium xiamenense]SEJ75033.1 hydroxypyruvate isomerase [Cyclobacterium xiamenense]